MYRFCIGELKLTIPQIRAMTVYELNRHMEWFKQKDDSLWHKIAVMSSIIIQPHVKKRIKPEDLIRIGEDVRKPEMSNEQIADTVKRFEAIYLERLNAN